MNKAMEKVTYKIQLNDFHTDPDKCRTLELDVDYPTKEDAAAAGWAIIEAFALRRESRLKPQGTTFEPPPECKPGGIWKRNGLHDGQRRQTAKDGSTARIIGFDSRLFH